jgi:hypothetical protein
MDGHIDGVNVSIVCVRVPAYMTDTYMPSSDCVSQVPRSIHNDNHFYVGPRTPQSHVEVIVHVNRPRHMGGGLQDYNIPTLLDVNTIKIHCAHSPSHPVGVNE